MTVSEFAIAMYDYIVKDTVMVIRDGETVYCDRMEFLRYADEYDPEKMWFAGETIQSVSMHADCNVRMIDYKPDYLTIIQI